MCLALFWKKKNLCLPKGKFGREEYTRSLRLTYIHYSSIYKTDNQQGSDVHRELYQYSHIITYMGKNLKKMDIDIFITESLCYIPETNAVWQINYTPI